MTDFSQIVNEEDSQTQGAMGGKFEVPVAEAGVALFRLREVVEFGTVYSKAYEKEQSPIRLVFELVHPRHAITKEDGTFIRNHEVTVSLPSKTFNEKSKYAKLFNKLNYDGAVATPKGKIPSFAAFLGKGFLGEVNHNIGKADGKTYVNLDKDGVYTIGAPRIAETDDMGAPTGNFKAVPVPEMSGEQRCFLWETGVSDEVYAQMWDSIAITGEKRDGTPFKNWIQEQIINGSDRDGPNTSWAGSRAERLFGENAEAEALLDAELACSLAPAADVVDFVQSVEQDTAAADPLAALV